MGYDGEFCTMGYDGYVWAKMGSFVLWAMMGMCGLRWGVLDSETSE